MAIGQIGADLSAYQRRTPVVNPLESLIQGFNQGQAIVNAPQQLQDQELMRQLNNALIRQKLADLADPNQALARQFALHLAPQLGKPESGVAVAPSGLIGQTIAQPGTVTAAQEQALGLPIAGGAVIAPRAPETPITAMGVNTGLNLNPAAASEAVAGQNAADLAKFTQQEQIRNSFKAPPSNQVISPGAVVIDASGKEIFRNPKENSSTLHNVPAGAKVLGPNNEVVFDNSNPNVIDKAKEALTTTLQRQVQSNKAYQAHRTVQDAMDGLQATLDYAKTNPRDQTGIKSSAVDSFNKIINPQSIVRQGAFAQTTSGQSILNKIDNFVNGLSTGQTISPSQIQTMLDLAKKYEEGSRKSVQRELAVIKHRGDTNGIDPANYIPDVFIGGDSSAPTSNSEDPLGIR